MCFSQYTQQHEVVQPFLRHRACRMSFKEPGRLKDRSVFTDGGEIGNNPLILVTFGKSYACDEFR